MESIVSPKIEGNTERVEVKVIVYASKIQTEDQIYALVVNGNILSNDNKIPELGSNIVGIRFLFILIVVIINI